MMNGSGDLSNDRSPDRPLRIGYVSPDFREHCQTFFTIPTLQSHDPKQVEIYCYADIAKPDALTDRLRSYAKVWRDTLGLSDLRVCDLIRADRIDILVDLTMHMANNRQMVFARKPAPIQITWLAYPGTTGQTAIDYRISDPYLDPLDIEDAAYSEKTIRLPESFWCYDPLRSAEPIRPLPAIRNGFVTFGCLNNFCKVNDFTLRLWGGVLRSLPDSRFLLLAPPGDPRKRVLQLMDVSEDRIDFVDYRPRAEYLEHYNRIDICLDTFPYNGHTTSLDAMWMGVPVVTLCGQTAPSRGGFSQASNLNLTELVANSPEQFANVAANLVADLDRLAALRSSLRERLIASPLMDAPRFARNLEALYRKVWCELFA
jgi:predicted O-linked N-acetylglucosamine transferase (SPINDLY family)